jgi:hypothetical protein
VNSALEKRRPTASDLLGNIAGYGQSPAAEAIGRTRHEASAELSRMTAGLLS